MENLNEYLLLLKSKPPFKRQNGGYNDDDLIRTAMEYAFSLVGVPYRWYIEGPFKEDDQFWVKNDEPPSAKEIFDKDKCIVCAGLTNLMRRKIGKNIPGIHPLLLNDDYNDDTKTGYTRAWGLEFPGTTGTWHHYLRQKGWLQDIDLNAEYPVGTLLTKDFDSIEGDQGHVAIVAGHGLTNKLCDSLVIHAEANYGISVQDVIKEGKLDKRVGETRIVPYSNIQEYYPKFGTTYFTHISLPDHWLLDK
jgi:hypothetical protein